MAAALASCFSMAFSNGLNKNGTPPDELNVVATSSFEQGDGGWKVASIHLEVKGQVPGLQESDFQCLAEDAKNNCPVSGALKGNVDLSVSASLQQ